MRLPWSSESEMPDSLTSLARALTTPHEIHVERWSVRKGTTQRTVTRVIRPDPVPIEDRVTSVRSLAEWLRHNETRESSSQAARAMPASTDTGNGSVDVSYAYTWVRPVETRYGQLEVCETVRGHAENGGIDVLHELDLEVRAQAGKDIYVIRLDAPSGLDVGADAAMHLLELGRTDPTDMPRQVRTQLLRLAERVDLHRQIFGVSIPLTGALRTGLPALLEQERADAVTRRREASEAQNLELARTRQETAQKQAASEARTRQIRETAQASIPDRTSAAITALTQMLERYLEGPIANQALLSQLQTLRRALEFGLRDRSTNGKDSAPSTDPKLDEIRPIAIDAYRQLVLAAGDTGLPAPGPDGSIPASAILAVRETAQQMLTAAETYEIDRQFNRGWGVSDRGTGKRLRGPLHLVVQAHPLAIAATLDLVTRMGPVAMILHDGDAVGSEAIEVHSPSGTVMIHVPEQGDPTERIAGYKTQKGVGNLNFLSCDKDPEGVVRSRNFSRPPALQLDWESLQRDATAAIEAGPKASSPGTTRLSH